MNSEKNPLLYRLIIGIFYRILEIFGIDIYENVIILKDILFEKIPNALIDL